MMKLTKYQQAVIDEMVSTGTNRFSEIRGIAKLNGRTVNGNCVSKMKDNGLLVRVGDSWPRVYELTEEGRRLAASTDTDRQVCEVCHKRTAVDEVNCEAGKIWACVQCMDWAGYKPVHAEVR